MAGYGKRSFDQCLTAIVSELSRAEENYHEWPDDVVEAASIISDKARELLSASIDYRRGFDTDSNRMLTEAVMTGAMALRFLLSMDSRLDYEMGRIDYDFI